MSEPEEKEPSAALTLFRVLIFLAAIAALIAIVEALGKADGSSETYLEYPSVGQTFGG
jgi:hypothetical protein